MPLSSAMSKISSLFSPSQSTATQGLKRTQPQRNRRKPQKYEDQQSQPKSSLEIGSTVCLSPSQCPNNAKQNLVLDTQPIVEGNDSLFVDTLTQSDIDVIPQTPLDASLPPNLFDATVTPSPTSLDVTVTPSPNISTLSSNTSSPTSSPHSHHGSLMKSSLLGTASPPSLLPLRDDALQEESIHRNDPSPDMLTSTPMIRSLAVRESQILERVNTSQEKEMALFRFRGNLSVLSNFYITKLKYNGMLFPSAEHAYQHKMALYHSRPDIAHNILQARTPAQAKAISKKVKKCEQWHEAKCSVMTDIVEAKAKQCSVFRDTLVSTKNKRLIHNIETDSFWGCGSDFLGMNMLGLLLEELRTKLITARNENDITKCKDAPQKDATPTYASVTTATTKLVCQSTSRFSNPQRPLVNPAQDNAGARPLPVPAPQNSTKDSPIILIGNSNVRDMATMMKQNTLDAQSTFYPGGTLEFIRSRIRHLAYVSDPSHIVLMAGDIEAVNGMSPDRLISQFKQLVSEIRRVYPWSRLILVGLVIAGDQKRRHCTQRVNALMHHLAMEERMIDFIDNKNSKLRDNIHLSITSKKLLCRRVATIIRKPHLRTIQKFR